MTYTSIHGKRFGLGGTGELVVDGNVLPVLGRDINIASMPGTGVGAKFNAAVEAVKAARDAHPANDTWFENSLGIVIPPGLYDLDEPLELIECSSTHVYAHGVEIRQLTTETFPGFRMINSPLARVQGLRFNFRNNNVANEVFDIAGMNAWAQFADCGVMANSSNANFAAARLRQGNINGLTPGDAIDSGRNNGNFWVTFNRFWTRKLAGADPNEIPIGIDLQGCQNAFRCINSSFITTTTGILVRNQDGSLFSGGPNDTQIHTTAFEGGAGSAFKMIAEGGATLSMSGGSISQCRFEAVDAVAEVVDLTVSPQAPMTLIGNEVISSVPNYIIGDENNFNVYDNIWTPAISPRILMRQGFRLPGHSGSGVAVLRVGPKAASDGGSLALERPDEVTIDGRLSQHAGGGMDIDGGTTLRVFAKNMIGLSGSDVHSANLRGVVAEPASGTTVAVTFPNAEADASYRILLQAPSDRRLWITPASQTVNGFEISTNVAFAAGGNIVWLLTR